MVFTHSLRYQSYSSKIEPYLRWASEGTYNTTDPVEKAKQEDDVLYYTDIFNYRDLSDAAL